MIYLIMDSETDTVSVRIRSKNNLIHTVSVPSLDGTVSVRIRLENNLIHTVSVSRCLGLGDNKVGSRPYSHRLGEN